MFLTAEQIQKYREEHPADELHAIKAMGGVVALAKPPSRAAFKRFRVDSTTPAGRLDALEGLGKSCVVLPDDKGLNALYDARPGLIETIGGELLELAGLTQNSASEKL
jgi:hypothetical protein